MRALDMIVEQPESFEIERQDGQMMTLTLYPLQLGRLMMISKRLISLDLSFSDEDSENAVKQMWEVCSTKTKDVAEIIAIATLRTKRQIDRDLQKRTQEILWSPTMTPQAYANILYFIVSQSYYEDFMRAIRSVKMLQVNISQETKAERIAPTEGKQSSEK